MSKPVERIGLCPGYSISRIIKGGWHLAGGHGKIDHRQAIEDMKAFVEAGITTFDCADIYTGVEDMIGQFLLEYRDHFHSGELSEVQIHTKYVPDYHSLPTLSKQDTEKVIDRSISRLGIEQLDLVQFHWWDFDIAGYVEAAQHLMSLREAGKIRHIGVTNFDGGHLQELLDSGVEVVSNQVQYSLLDHRPEHDLVNICENSNVYLLCYGSLSGGFLSERYLEAPEPVSPLENRSLVKYRLIIDEFGGYDQFRHLLKTLKEIGDQYNATISEVASRYILQKSRVGGVIIGARNRDHLDSMRKLSSLKLVRDEMDQLHQFALDAPGPTGPVYDLERDKEGRHGRIMKYNLNKERA